MEPGTYLREGAAHPAGGMTVYVEKRRAIGTIVSTRKPIFMTAVLVNGHTVAQFADEADADAYIDEYAEANAA